MSTQNSTSSSSATATEPAPAGRTDAPPEPAPSASPLDRHAAPVADQGRRPGQAVAALVLGIIGVLGAFLLPMVGLILGVVATVFGAMARKEIARRSLAGGPQATAGLILGVIAIIGSIANMIATAIILA
jgi:hypothetical protein